MKTIISPSLLAADFANLERDVRLLNESCAEWIHLDVMDGVFVPNISFGFPVIEAIRKHTKKFLDVHLMITQPDKYLPQFRDAGADHITVHYEGNLHLDSLVSQIKKLGLSCGVAINPATPVAVLDQVIDALDVVLVMSVNPGFGGQQFIPYSIDKVRDCAAMIAAKKSRARVEVDGGVGLQNADQLKAAGASILVAGNAVFKHENPKWVIEELGR